MLSAVRTEDFVSMIDRGDVKALTSLPKIGKKTAEQIVLSLKGQLVLDDKESNASSFVARDEIVSALVNLGFGLSDVETVVGDMDTGIDLQQGIRQGLAALTTHI